MSRQRAIAARMAAGARRATQVLLAAFAAVVLTAMVFLVLPLIQQVSQPPASDMELRAASTASLPPPPPPPPPAEDEQKEEEEPPPDLSAPDMPPMDLASLELALNPTVGDGWGPDVGGRLLAGAENRASEDAEAIFSVADLDQAPRILHQPAPEYPPDLKRKKIEGTVQILFLVDGAGRVQNPTVQQATHPAFERAALQAVRRWRFEPGKRNGQPVSFRMKAPITFALR